MRIRLGTRYIISMLSLVLSVVLILAGTLLFQFRGSTHRMVQSSSTVLEGDLLTQLKYRGASLVQFLGRDLTTPLYRYDIEELYQILKLARSQQEVSYAYVYDREGRIVHDGLAVVPQAGQMMADGFGQEALQSDGLLIQTTPTLMEVSYPIVFGGAPLGGVRLGLDLQGMKKDIANMQTQIDLIHDDSMKTNMIAILSVALGLSLLASLAGVWFSRSLTQPIINLARMAGRIGRGEYDNVDPGVQRADEIGYLATAFVKMAEDLQKTTVSKTYMDNIITQMIDTLCVVSLDGKILRANRALCELLYYREPELTGQPFDRLFAEESYRRIWLDRIKKDTTMAGMELDYLAKGGRKIPVQFAAAVIKDAAGQNQAIVCVARDITQLKKNQKFAAIGQLAASVAHELRNPLGAIQNSLYYLKDCIINTPVAEKDPTIAEFMEIANKEIVRSNRIVSELLEYSREVKLKPVAVDPVSVLDEITSCLEVPENMKLIVLHGEKLPLVLVDTQKLQQVVLNLATNAFQAMPKGGQLTVRQQVDRDEDAREWLRIDFQDTGVGISEENLRYVFEPLFTTKTKGTGLGLAICQEIIKAHGGKIEVQSQFGKGTIMSIRLPVPPAPLEKAA